MNELGVTLWGEPFPCMLFHFVQAYSNWETGKVLTIGELRGTSEG